ncbi:MAG: hypothetical protein ACRD6W_07940 [Nitrososphaerales archaeon]
MILTILIMVVAETAWALFSAETGMNLFVFYAVLVALSAVFWLPDLAKKRLAPEKAAGGDLETNR